MYVVVKNCSVYNFCNTTIFQTIVTTTWDIFGGHEFAFDDSEKDIHRI